MAERLKTVAATFREDALTKSAPYRNHWLCGANGGSYGTDYARRTAANYTGIWANTPSEVVYYAATKDADDKPGVACRHEREVKTTYNVAEILADIHGRKSQCAGLAVEAGDPEVRRK